MKSGFKSNSFNKLYDATVSPAAAITIHLFSLAKVKFKGNSTLRLSNNIIGAQDKSLNIPSMSFFDKIS